MNLQKFTQKSIEAKAKIGIFVPMDAADYAVGGY